MHIKSINAIREPVMAPLYTVGAPINERIISRKPRLQGVIQFTDYEAESEKPNDEDSFIITIPIRVIKKTDPSDNQNSFVFYTDDITIERT